MTEQALFDTAPFTQEPGPETWFPEGIFKGQPRPDEFHDLVVRRVVEEVLQEVMDWQGSTGEFNDDEDAAEEVRKDLLEAISYGDDGYGICRDLDSSGWSPDSELVDILDNLEWHAVTRAAVKRWVLDNQVAPRLAVGAPVKVYDHHFEGKPTSSSEPLREGEVVRVDLDGGTYTVFVPSLGHVREGVGSHGRIYPWALVEAWTGVV